MIAMLLFLIKIQLNHSSMSINYDSFRDFYI